MRMVLLSMQRLRDVTGRVCNQAPDSFLEADKSLALDKASGAVARNSAAIETLGRSQDFCRCDTVPKRRVRYFGQLSDGRIPKREY